MILLLVFIFVLFVSVLLLIYGIWRGVKIYIKKEVVEQTPPVIFETLDRELAGRFLPKSDGSKQAELVGLNPLHQGQEGMV